MDGTFSIPVIIGFYMFISASLLVFNVLYIIKQRGTDARHGGKTEAWLREIEPRLNAMQAEPRGHVDPSHRKRLAEKLRHTTELMGYHSAMQRMAKRHKARDIRAYLGECSPSFERLASGYARRKDMEKAYFAYVLSQFPPAADETRPPEEMLLPYLTGTNVYCRENTLRALYALGDAAAVEHAFVILAEQHIFHHEKLLTGGLMTFSGDKGALAGQLWRYVPDWPAHMGVAVVQFIEQCGAGYCQAFYDALAKPGLDLHVRLSILHYFRRYPFEPMRPLLLQYLNHADGMATELAIASASTLAAYPGQESIDALKSALFSRNWHVRNNAALSLLALETDSRDLDEALQGNDRYALEMLCYHVQSQGEEERVPQCVRREAKEKWN